MKRHISYTYPLQETSQPSPDHGSPRPSSSSKRQQLVDANGRFLPGVAMKEKSAFKLQDDGTIGTPARWPQVTRQRQATHDCVLPLGTFIKLGAVMPNTPATCMHPAAEETMNV